MFEGHWDRGIAALLRKDYPTAWEAFCAADAVKPGDPVVAANLGRLRDMGHAGDAKEEG